MFLWGALSAGASLLEIYTALVYKGLGLVPELKQKLDYLLRRDGFHSVAEAVGVDIHLTMEQKDVK